MPCKVLEPEGSALVTSRSHRFNPTLAKEVGAPLNQYFAAGLIIYSIAGLEPSGGHPDKVWRCTDHC